MTTSYVILQVSSAAYNEIREKLRQAGYGHALHETIVMMDGIALSADHRERDNPGPECMHCTYAGNGDLYQVCGRDDCPHAKAPEPQRDIKVNHVSIDAEGRLALGLTKPLKPIVPRLVTEDEPAEPGDLVIKVSVGPDGVRTETDRIPTDSDE